MPPQSDISRLSLDVCYNLHHKYYIMILLKHKGNKENDSPLDLQGQMFNTGSITQMTSVCSFFFSA